MWSRAALNDRRILTGKAGTSMMGFDRITFSPDVMAGRACIRGKRVALANRCLRPAKHARCENLPPKSLSGRITLRK